MMPEPPKRRGRKRKNRDLESTEGRDVIKAQGR